MNLRKEAENILKGIGDRESLGVDCDEDWDDILDFIEERLRRLTATTRNDFHSTHCKATPLGKAHCPVCSRTQQVSEKKE
jgi:hypothetical protein